VSASLRADQVLVTIGSPCSMSAVGGTATTRTLVERNPEHILHAAFDAGLVDLAIAADGSVTATWLDGTPAAIDAVDARHGVELRAGMGIRRIAEYAGVDVLTDIAAPLPHDLATGGLRRLAGLTYDDIRGSELRDMHGLFDDDARLGPSLQSQLFAHAGLGALAALPMPLHRLLPDPYEFRVAAGASFPGMDSMQELRSPADALDGGGRDKFAARLASSLASHGPALLSTMLSPSYPLSRTAKNPELLATLASPSGYRRVPQTPLLSVGACASSLIALCELAPGMLLELPGHRPAKLALWTSADTATLPDWRVVEAFGPNALVTSHKIDAMNADRAPADRRTISDSLAPFDVDACGTVIGDGGSGIVVTTLDFALRSFLDITSIIVGWGQSGETGGKAHFAGVGFGGENAIIQTFAMASAGHGYGVGDFGYLVAHATGTRTNSRTDLAAAAAARTVAAAQAGSGRPPAMYVGAPKALGDGHTMGETGLKAVGHALQYLLGREAVGVPTLRRLDPELESVVDQFILDPASVAGDADGGALCATQGFGGYNGAVALRAANADTIGRYQQDPGVLSAYLERWPQIRAEREQRERRSEVTRRAAIDLAQLHRWTPTPD
jgi:3-oxoacyl-[acyl-carrier-protein] synthase II